MPKKLNPETLEKLKRAAGILDRATSDYQFKGEVNMDAITKAKYLIREALGELQDE